MTVDLLHALDFTVLREGNVVSLPGGQTLFVTEACSGITSIVTLLPLGVLLAALGEPTRARQVVLVVAVVPIAMLGNMLRVLVTVFAANSYGVATATSGALHDSAGLLTFVGECLVLIALTPLMRRILGDGRVAAA